MAEHDRPDHLITQGRALVRAIQALETIEPSDEAKQAPARQLIAVYRQGLRTIIGAAPTWVGDRILGASDSIADNRAVLFSLSRPHAPLGQHPGRQSAVIVQRICH